PGALAYAERYMKKYAGDPLVTAAIAPHSTYLAAPETLKAARALADKYGAPILIHLQESPDEQKQIQEKYGKSSTQHLKDLGVLRKGLLGAHGVYLNADDRKMLKDAGAGVAHCPQSNMKLASGAA